MKQVLLILVVLFQFSFVCFGQDNNKPAPAITNIAGVAYPLILPDLRVEFSIKAPDAQKVQIDLGKMYNMTRDDQGVWTVTTDPQVPGFHYYVFTFQKRK